MFTLNNTASNAHVHVLFMSMPLIVKTVFIVTVNFIVG